MANWSGITATLAALARPRTLQPNLVVPSIANLDWHRLRHHAGVHAVVVDKDNCIAKPNEDDLANSDELRRAWAELLDTFGAENVVVVSNTAGDLRKDPLLIQSLFTDFRNPASLARAKSRPTSSSLAPRPPPSPPRLPPLPPHRLDHTLLL
ncbi:hypothetical protein JCM10295v2_006703 [Rhodotorula toruloides]